MAETAASIIRDALELLLVQDAEAPIQANEVQSAIRFLNRMMDRLAARGISLGYTSVSNLGDPITVPPGAVEGIIANLALAIGPLFLEPNEDVPLSVQRAAKEGMSTIRIIAKNIDPTANPNTLPVGSGNEGTYLGTDTHFYPTPSTTVSGENNQTILVEDNTI